MLVLGLRLSCLGNRALKGFGWGGFQVKLKQRKALGLEPKTLASDAPSCFSSAWLFRHSTSTIPGGATIGRLVGVGLNEFQHYSSSGCLNEICSNSITYTKSLLLSCIPKLITYHTPPHLLLWHTSRPYCYNLSQNLITPQSFIARTCPKTLLLESIPNLLRYYFPKPDCYNSPNP